MRLITLFKSLNNRYNINLVSFLDFKDFFIFNYYIRNYFLLNDNILNTRDKNYFSFN